MIFILLVLSLLNVALVHAQGLTQTEFVMASKNAGAISHSPVGVTGSPVMSTSTRSAIRSLGGIDRTPPIRCLRVIPEDNEACSGQEPPTLLWT